MKSYTDIEQSKKLAEILHIKSADMGWNVFIDDSSRCLPIDDWALTKTGEHRVEFIPCWSLAALLSVISEYTLQTTADGKVFVVSESKKLRISDDYDNPVDACFEMVVKLHELKML